MEEIKHNINIGDKFHFWPQDEKGNYCERFIIGSFDIPCPIYGKCRYNDEVIFTIAYELNDHYFAEADDDYLVYSTIGIMMGINKNKETNATTYVYKLKSDFHKHVKFIV